MGALIDATGGDDGAGSPSILSILVALLLPLLLNSVLKETQDRMIERLNDWYSSALKQFDGVGCARTLEWVETFDKYGYAMRGSSADAEDRNEILIKAILEYVSARPVPSFDGCLTLMPRLAGEDDAAEDDAGFSAARALRRLEIRKTPTSETTTVVSRGAVAVSMRLDRSKSGCQDKSSATFGRKTVTTTLTLTARSPRGAEAAEAAIRDFTEAAFAFRRRGLALKEAREGRFMFSPIAKSENSWKRYALADEKTFDALFFAEKPRVLRLLEDFEAKRGKFAIAGVQHKLGLLLHGPPGTGKTSLIKAVAHRTGRHVVNVPLSRVRTNQRLYDMLFDGRFETASETFEVPPDKCVFVMEDVDACSDVVLDRGGDCKDGKAPRGDELSLAGLLNALDGIVEAPGRIVVLTSNHPEKLDPALVRPGRVTMKLYLGHVDGASAEAMCRHYFGAGGDVAAVAAAVEALADAGKRFSPAQLEHLCAAHETVDDLRAELVGLHARLQGEAVRASLDAVLADVPEELPLATPGSAPPLEGEGRAAGDLRSLFPAAPPAAAGQPRLRKALSEGAQPLARSEARNSASP